MRSSFEALGGLSLLHSSHSGIWSLFGHFHLYSSIPYRLSSMPPNMSMSRMDDVYMLLGTGVSTSLGSGILTVNSAEQVRNGGLMDTADHLARVFGLCSNIPGMRFA